MKLLCFILFLIVICVNSLQEKTNPSENINSNNLVNEKDDNTTISNKKKNENFSGPSSTTTKETTSIPKEESPPKKLSKKKQKRLEKALKRNEEMKTKRLKKREKEVKKKILKNKKEAAKQKELIESQTPEVIEKALIKEKKLTQKAQGTSNNLIALQHTSLQTFVLDSPRNYYVFLAITTLAAGKCDICKIAHVEMEKVALSYRERGVMSGEQPIFFAILEISTNQEYINKMKLDKVPYYLIVPPKLGISSLTSEKFLRSIPESMFFRLTSLDNIDIAFTTFIRNQIGINIDIIPPLSFDWIFYLILIGGVLAYIIYFPFSTQPILYFFIFSMVYGICVGGYQYTRIRNMPWSSKDHKNNEIFIGRSGEQFIAEAFIIGGLNILAALSVIFLNTATGNVFALPHSDKNNNSNWGWIPLTFIKKISYKYGRNMLFTLAIISLHMMFGKILSIYYAKYPSYVAGLFHGAFLRKFL